MNKTIKILLLLILIVTLSNSAKSQEYKGVLYFPLFHYSDGRGTTYAYAVEGVTPEATDIEILNYYAGYYVIEIYSLHAFNDFEHLDQPRKSNVKSVKMPSTIRHIYSEAFMDLPIKSIVIPKDCTAIGIGAIEGDKEHKYQGAFEGCTSLRYIRSDNILPPVCDSNTFNGVPLDECVLEVPIGGLRNYKRSPVWENFKNIREVSPSGIGDVAEDDAVSINAGKLTSGKDGLSVAVYCVDGRCVVSRILSQGESIELPGRGIYIVVADGKSRKIAY